MAHARPPARALARPPGRAAPALLPPAVDWSQLQPDPRRPPDGSHRPTAACAAGRHARPTGASATCCARWAPSSARATASRSWCRSTACRTGPPRAARLRAPGHRPALATDHGRGPARLPRASCARWSPCSRRGRGAALVDAVERAQRAVLRQPPALGLLARQHALAPGVYTRLARALRAELEAQPGDQGLVVGELAGVATARLRGLDPGVLRRAARRRRVRRRGLQPARLRPARQQADDPVIGQLEARWPGAVHAGKPIWVTETGVGGAHVGDARSRGRHPARGLPRNAAASPLARDPRVDAAFQYTFRDDPVFPVGLADDRSPAPGRPTTCGWPGAASATRRPIAGAARFAVRHRPPARSKATAGDPSRQTSPPLMAILSFALLELGAEGLGHRPRPRRAGAGRRAWRPSTRRRTRRAGAPWLLTADERGAARGPGRSWSGPRLLGVANYAAGLRTALPAPDSDSAVLRPDPGQPPDWAPAHRATGAAAACRRILGHSGIRDALRAIASQPLAAPGRGGAGLRDLRRAGLGRRRRPPAASAPTQGRVRGEIAEAAMPAYQGLMRRRSQGRLLRGAALPVAGEAPGTSPTGRTSSAPSGRRAIARPRSSHRPSTPAWRGP